MGRQIITAHPTTGSGPSTTVVNYGSPWMFDVWQTAIAAAETICAHAGTVNNLFLDTYGVAPGSGKSWTAVLYVNGSPTALTTTIADAQTSNSDTTHSVPVAVGDRLAIQITPSGTPTAAPIMNSTIEIVSTLPRQSTYGTARSATFTGNNFFRVAFNPTAAWSTTISGDGDLCSLAGTIDGLYLTTSAAIATGSYTFHLVKNGTVQDGTGGTVDTTLTISGAGPFSVTFTLPVAPGDVVGILGTPNNTPTATSLASSIRFTSDTDRQSILGGSGSTSIFPPTPSYNWPTGDNSSFQSADTSVHLPVGVSPFTISAQYVRLSADPAPGNITLTFRKSSVDQALSALVPSGSKVGHDTTHSVDLAHGNTWGLKRVAVSNSATMTLQWVVAVTTADPEPSGGGGGVVEDANMLGGTPLLQSSSTTPLGLM